MARGHIDIAAADVVWREGSDPGIRYARFLLDAEKPSAPSIILSRFEPGCVVAPHTHDTNYFEYIIAGEQTVGKTRFGAGDVRIVKGGTGYGPIIVGSEGCTVLIVFENGGQAITVPMPRRTAAAAE
jgi:anti-sigma factor ChrR (cupin superfamily)